MQCFVSAEPATFDVGSVVSEVGSLVSFVQTADIYGHCRRNSTHVTPAVNMSRWQNRRLRRTGFVLALQCTVLYFNVLGLLL